MRATAKVLWVQVCLAVTQEATKGSSEESTKIVVTWPKALLKQVTWKSGIIIYTKMRATAKVLWA